jgi:hypothetical protein
MQHITYSNMFCIKILEIMDLLSKLALIFKIYKRFIFHNTIAVLKNCGAFD